MVCLAMSLVLALTSCCKKPALHPNPPPIVVTAPIPDVCEEMKDLPPGPKLGAVALPVGHWIRFINGMIDPVSRAIDFTEDDYTVDRRALIAMGMWLIDVTELARKSKACRAELKAQHDVIDTAEHESP